MKPAGKPAVASISPEELAEFRRVVRAAEDAQLALQEAVGQQDAVLLRLLRKCKRRPNEGIDDKTGAFGVPQPQQGR